MWLALSGLAVRRFFKYRHSPIEVMYAVAFFTFGLTALREAYGLQSWLILLKTANLVVLIWLRAIVIKSFYPGSKLF